MIKKISESDHSRVIAQTHVRTQHVVLELNKS